MNFIIPYTKRSTHIGTNYNETTVMDVDGVGVYVGHPRGEVPSSDLVRRHLMGISNHTWWIEADSLEDALKKFHDTDGAKIGSKNRAIVMNVSKRLPIREYVGCKDMSEDGHCKYFDDEFTEPDSHLLCILGGCDDVHDSCPIKQQMEKESEVIQIGDVWVQRYSDKPVISLW